MITMKEEDKRILLRAVSKGHAVLFLGAGASATSLSKAGEKILQGRQLAKKLAEMGGLEYHDEPLPSVISAVVGSRISRVQFEQFLRDEFMHCEPSAELKTLMTFCWARLYTWNLDDTVPNCRSTAQRLKTFNGMLDPVSPNENISFLQVVHLHGEAWKPEHGYIFSEAEYNAAISKGHAWYSQAISDYVEKLPIFIGSQLKEPILSLELDRARPRATEGLGVALLISPDEFTQIHLADFEARGITAVKGDLSDFVKFLQHTVSVGGLFPKSIIANRSETGRTLVERGNVTVSDLTVAQHLRVVSDGMGNISIPIIPRDNLSKESRYFLEGKPPSWEIVHSNVPPELNQVRALLDQLEECFTSEERLFVVYGQSGSGKTTAVMQALLNVAIKQKEIPIYELNGNISSLREAMGLLARLHREEKIIVYFGESFIFGDSFAEDLLSVDAGRMLFVGDARTNEWKNHIRRRLEGVNYRSFEFQRFSPEDFDGLARVILDYVPAPRFHKMSPQQRTDEFMKSKSQLLIAMKEVTQARTFRETIAQEYRDLPDDDCRVCFLICSVATLARSGISRGMATEAYDNLPTIRAFGSSVNELEGVVFENRNGRLVARHEVYVRHVLENVASIELLRNSIIGVLQAFTKFDVPVIRKVGRQDALLFRFALNHNFLRELFRIKGARLVPSEIYGQFEVEFQRDGHFWLQYGQYLSSMGQYAEALPVLEKSIQAYPENNYAAHALADVQLRVAQSAPSWTGSVAELVGHAVATLEELHASRSDLADQYAIVTLAERHVGVLVKHERLAEAKDVARNYFKAIGSIKSSVRNDLLENARTNLMHFLVSGQFSEGISAAVNQVRSTNQIR